MKIQVNSEINGNELIAFFLSELKKSNIDGVPEDIKILVKSKDDKEVDIAPSRIRLSYNKTQI